MMDEMDLAGQALQVTPWRPEEYEQARTRLRAAMAKAGPLPEAAPVTPLVPLRGRGFSGAGHRHRGLGAKGKFGIGAGIAGVAAAAVAVALVATSTSQPAATTAGPAPRVPAATSPLMTLAARITAGRSTVPGDASLVIATKHLGSTVEVVYSLYTDSGSLYTGDDKKTLMAAVINNENQADGFNDVEKPARYAASGDLATARKMMAEASVGNDDYFLSYAARKKIWDKNLPALLALLRAKGSRVVPQMPTGQVLQDDINIAIWNGCQDALLWSGNDPQARAGVMRLLASIPNLTVVHSTTDGQPTLTITAGPKGFDNFTQVVTVSAATGLQISLVSSSPGVGTGGETDQNSRVTMAAVKAGKF
jgi:hypothetical protein